VQGATEQEKYMKVLCLLGS